MLEISTENRAKIQLCLTIAAARGRLASTDDVARQALRYANFEHKWQLWLNRQDKVDELRSHRVKARDELLNSKVSADPLVITWANCPT